jgi:hypothetical protein
MSERDDAIRLAALNTLDTPGRDPDDDLSMMSRQFLRALERCEWRPVESAPKDGTKILVYTIHGDVEVTEFCVMRRTVSDPVGDWNGSLPTHWMPLPVPPR